MKKILLLIIIFSFTIVSCLEVTNYISLDKNGNINTSLIFSIDKSVLEMIAYENDSDYSTTLLEFDNELRDSFPDTFKVKRKISENYISWHVTGNIPKSMIEEYNQVIPIKNGKYYICDISELVNTPDSEYEDIDTSLLSSMKYKLMIDKNYIKNIKKCFIQNDFQYEEATYFDMINFYIIEIPLYSNIEDAMLFIET